METIQYVQHLTNRSLLKRITRSIRRIIFTSIVKHTAAYAGEGCCVNYYSKVTKNTYLSGHVSFNGMNIVGNAKVEISKYFHSGRECQIITSNHNYEGDAIPYDNMDIAKDVKIGDFVWLGNRVMILPGATIGEGAIIQAGAVVVSDIPPCAIAGGNPAKVFKYRDVEHFNETKKAMKYY